MNTTLERPKEAPAPAPVALPSGTGRRMLLCGAASAIAQELARTAPAGTRLFLAARDAAKLEAVAADLRGRGHEVAGTAALDLRDAARHGVLFDDAAAALGGAVDLVVIAHGYLGDQAKAQADWTEAREILETNFLSAASLMSQAAERFAKQGAGQLVVIGSVAGDRGRQSNYFYGAAKGAVEILAEGLRHRLAPLGVPVLLVKPGFVDTPMTAHLPKTPLFAAPRAIAEGIWRAIESRRAVVYLPWFWRYILLMIRSLPRAIFHRLKI